MVNGAGIGLNQSEPNFYFKDENDQFCIVILDEPLGLKYGCALMNPHPNNIGVSLIK